MDQNSRSNNLVEPKSEIYDSELPSQTLHSTQLGDNVASSSRSNVRSFFTEMGYSPALVDKVIEENGEDNVDLLLEILMECSDLQNPNCQSSSSLDCLFDDRSARSPPEYSSFAKVKEEPDVSDTVYDDKRACLLKMHFSAKEVEFAMDKLGENAPISEIVDFIFAAQIAENLDEGTDEIPIVDVEKKEDIDDETLYGTMDKTLHLLNMGFSESEVSLAIDKFGSELPITELADAICAHQLGEDYFIKKKYYENSTASCSYVSEDGRYFFMETENDARHRSFGSVKFETEDCSQDAVLQSRGMTTGESHEGRRPRQVNREETWNGKRPRQEQYREPQLRHVGLGDNSTGEQPKQEYYDGSSSYFGPEWVEEEVKPADTSTFGIPKPFKPNSCKIRNQIAAKPPYLFYGNVATASSETWRKVSQFLYGIEPEFVDTQFFSALSRREGYIHNLPTEIRFRILPKPSYTLEDLMPRTTKWWPSWDTRKKLSSRNFETSGSSQLCDMLGRMLDDSRGVLSPEQLRDLLHHCQTSNLIWVGLNKLAPIEPVHLEKMLGYPLNHTLIADIRLAERLHSLRYSFQTDTLGYHLSGLKSMFPEGITVMSLFSGIGGAEVALHRLGIHLKGVVSVEPSETNRRILKRWWQSSGQTGRLEQIEDIQKLTSNTVEKLVEKFGGFDIIICQNSFSQPPEVVNKIGSAGEESHPIFDFSLFNEFVRVFQRIRSTMERKRQASLLNAKLI